MYELFIKHEKYGWVQLDLGDKNPVLTLQFRDIADAEEKGSFSQNISLPKTSNNVKYLDNLQKFESISKLRHKLLTANLYADGSLIVDQGGFKIVNDDKADRGFFNVQIFSSKKVFSLILQEDDKNINDLNFSQTIRRNLTGAAASVKTLDPVFFFALADFSKEFNGIYSIFNSGTNPILTGVNLSGQKPFVRYKRIIEKIVAEAGYSLTHDLGQDEQWQKACIPLDTLTPTFDISLITSLQIFTTDSSWYLAATPTSNDWFVSSQLTNVHGTPSSNAGQITINAGSPFNNTPQMYFRIPSSGYYFFDLEYTLFRQGNPGPGNLGQIHYGIRVLSSTSPTGNFVQIGQFTAGPGSTPSSQHYFHIQQPYLLAAESYIIFAPFGFYDAAPQQGNTLIHSLVNLKFSVYDFIFNAIEDAAPHEIISLKGNLPNFSVFDFFKSFLQIFARTFSVNEGSKTVDIFGLQSLIDNFPNALNWSNKHSISSGQEKPNLPGYARENFIFFKEEELDKGDEFFTQIDNIIAAQLFERDIKIYWADSISALKQTVMDLQQITEAPITRVFFIIETTVSKLVFEDKDSILALDENIEVSKNFVELPFEATIDKAVQPGNLIAKIRHLDADNSTFEGGKISKLLMTQDLGIGQQVPVRVRKIDVNAGAQYNLWRVSAENIRAQKIKQKYSTLENYILGDMRMIEGVEFNLNANDIKNFNPKIPIYLEYYGSYFYVNKISNFEVGRLTKCDIIRIGLKI
jgi:hypothetical protein